MAKEQESDWETKVEADEEVVEEQTGGGGSCLTSCSVLFFFPWSCKGREDTVGEAGDHDQRKTLTLTPSRYSAVTGEVKDLSGSQQSQSRCMYMPPPRVSLWPMEKQTETEPI